MSSQTSSGPILIYLGANAHEALERQLLALDPGIKFVDSAVYPERQLSPDTDARLGDAVIRFDAEMRGPGGDILFTSITGCNQVGIIETVMDDKLLPLLWTRFGGQTRWRHLGEVKRYEVVYSLAKSAIEACRKHKPRAVVFSYEPHMLPMYVFKKVCKALGIPSRTMIVSPFNWKMFLDETNVDAKTSVAARLPSGDASARPGAQAVARFIDEKKGDYSVAKPFYEKRLHSVGGARRLIFKLKANGWKPHKVVLGQMAEASYRRLSTPRAALQGKPYVCLFLQLQPEQTTLPDGGLFVHHLFVIQALYAALEPLGISLVIREHPATFETAYNITWRPRDFYRSIKAIGPAIHFDEPSADPYSLIKNAVAVSAITGTVLLEGLLQGRPAIAFGKHPLKGLIAPGFVDSFAHEVELRTKIQAALAQSPQTIIRDVENYLYQVYPASFGPSEYVGNASMSLDLLREARYTALRQIIGLMSKEHP